jgi:hypothetical protein
MSSPSAGSCAVSHAAHSSPIFSTIIFTLTKSSSGFFREAAYDPALASSLSMNCSENVLDFWKEY